MSPRIIACLHIPRGAAQTDIHLIVHCARPGLQLPMQFPRRQVEGAGVQEEERAISCCYSRELREAHVVADCDADFAVLGEVDEGDFVAWREDF